MIYVMTTVLSLCGWCLGISVVKTLSSLPERFVNVGLYASTAIAYVAFVFSRVDSDNATLFHFAWSVVLLILVVGMLRRQSQRFRRVTLLVTSMAALAIGTSIVRDYLYDTYDNAHWYILRIEHSVLVVVPIVAMAGVLFGSVLGFRKDRKTGQLKAQHWTWACLLESVGLIFLFALTVVANDVELRWRRDALIERAQSLESRLVARLPKSDQERYSSSTIRSRHSDEFGKVFAELGRLRDSQPATDTGPNAEREPSVEFAAWIEDVERTLEPVDQIVAAEEWTKLHPLPADEIGEIAELYLDLARFRNASGNVRDAIDAIVDATMLLDRGVAPDSDVSDLIRTESIRRFSIQRLIGRVGANEVKLLRPLITDKPYTETIGSPNYDMELQVIASLKQELDEPRDRDPFFTGVRDTLSERFFELRGILSQVDGELDGLVLRTTDSTWQNEFVV
ncbi:hypothetical protein ACFL2H_11520, partial [Planctomycetota bacterium]